MGRPRRGRRQDRRHLAHRRQGRRPVRQPRHAARTGQGRHVQRLRMGQLLPRRRHQRRQPADRAARDRDLCGDRGAAGFAGLHAAATGRPHGRRAVLRRHALSRAAHAGRVPAARPDQGLPRAERLTQPLQPDDEGRARGDDADRALYHARREEGLPHDLLGLLSRHGSRLRPGRCRDLRGVQPRGARGRAPHQRQQGRLSALLHRLP